MSAGTIAGFVVAGLTLFVSVANLVFAALGHGTVWEVVFWTFGALVGLFGMLVFYRRHRARH